MIVHASQSSLPQPPEDTPAAAQSAEQAGDFTQLLFLLLVPQTTVVNQNPEASESTIAGASSATLVTTGSASRDTNSFPAVDPPPQAPVVSAANFQIAPAELGANNPNVNSPSSSANAGVPEAAQQQVQGEKPGRSDISLNEETAPAIQPAIGGSGPVMTQRVATAEIPADAEAVLGQSAGEQKHQVLQTTGSPAGQIHGATAVQTHGVSGASVERQPLQTVTDVPTNDRSVGDLMPISDVNGGSESEHPKHDLLAGEDGSGWQEGAEKNPAASNRSIHTVDAFNPFIARAEQDPAVTAAPSSAWRPLVDRLAGDISSHLRLGKSAAVLQLDPPELGKIKIDLRMEDGRLHARIIAEGHESKALIEAHLPDLRQALLAGKIEVADVRISQGNWNGAGDLGQGLQQQEHGRQEPGRGFDTRAMRSPDGEEPRRQTSARDGGRVSMWA
ncbi:MAG: flagellar hook-length control protein FliK [Candidatus Binatia bacterium]